MFKGTYAPWEHYPKHLRHEEIIAPFKVLELFFEIDSLMGHREQLQLWKESIIQSIPYIADRSNGRSLLFIWKYNLKLMEAMYLLWQAHQNAQTNGFFASEWQIAQEKETWVTFPPDLKQEYSADPYQIVQQFFQILLPAIYRDQLFIWLDMALADSAKPE